LDARDAGGPFPDWATFKKRVPVTLKDLVPLARAGALDCFGCGRPVLLREMGVAPEAAGTDRSGDSWPLDGLLGHPLEHLWRGEWEVWGFFAGPPLAGLLRRALPPGLADSRSLPERVNETVRLAGVLLPHGTERPTPGAKRVVTIEDEFGPVEVL